MPKAIAYRASSVIYFQGDLSDKIYILQTGKVSLNYTDIETGQEMHELIQLGEFFGVKSALGKYPREENALVLQDATVLCFTVPEFEQFVMANTRIIMKMLKVFSNQLRRIHKQVENLLEKDEQVSPEVGLYRTGEYYLKNRQYSQAKYAFSRYLTYYPAGKMANEASRNLEVAENAMLRYGQGKGPAPIMPQSGGAPAPHSQAPAQPQAQAQAPAQAGSSSGGNAAVTKDFYNAVSLFSQEKFQNAAQEFKKIVDANADPEYSAKATFEIGKCLFALGQFDAVIAHLTRCIQSYPKHPDLVDSLFYIGQAWEKKGDAAKATAFYRKIIATPGDEDSSARIKAKKALKALGQG